MRNFETTFDLRCGRILEINGLERVIKESIAAAPEALVCKRQTAWGTKGWFERAGRRDGAEVGKASQPTANPIPVPPSATKTKRTLASENENLPLIIAAMAKR
jgi:hypothetical protein